MAIRVVAGLFFLTLVFPMVAAAGAERESPGAEDGVKPGIALGRQEHRSGLFQKLSLTSGSEPIVINADKLELDYKQSKIIYSGGVVVTRGDTVLHSNILTVTYTPGREEQLKKVVAEGEVKITQGDRWATSNTAVFDEDKQVVVLSDNAVLHDGPSQVTGDRIVVFLQEERSVVEGGKRRVKAVLYPEGTEGTGE